MPKLSDLTGRGWSGGAWLEITTCGHGQSDGPVTLTLSHHLPVL